MSDNLCKPIQLYYAFYIFLHAFKSHLLQLSLFKINDSELIFVRHYIFHLHLMPHLHKRKQYIHLTNV